MQFNVSIPNKYSSYRDEPIRYNTSGYDDQPFGTNVEHQSFNYNTANQENLFKSGNNDIISQHLFTKDRKFASPRVQTNNYNIPSYGTQKNYKDNPYRNNTTNDVPDDSLYQNLEEEYLHRVSKRTNTSKSPTINKSVYNFK